MLCDRRHGSGAALLCCSMDAWTARHGNWSTRGSDMVDSEAEGTLHGAASAARRRGWPPKHEDAILAPISDVMKCGICLGLLFEPVLTQCSHSYCKACLETCKQCPSCRALIEVRTPNRPLTELIGALQCLCPASDGPHNRCLKPVALSEMRRHRRKDCVFTRFYCQFRCNGCNIETPRRRLITHEDECGYRKIACPMCAEKNLRKLDERSPEERVRGKSGRM